MRTRRDFLTPAIVIIGVVIVIMFLWTVIAEGQTHTMPGSNVVPSGASLTIQSGGSIIASPGSTVTGFGVGGGAGTVTDFSAGDLSPLFTTTEATTTTTPALSFSLTNAAATTVFGRAAGTSGAPTYSSAPQFLKIGNLTTNGFVKTGSADGTLSVDTATYQASDSDLTTWAGITPGTGVGTFLATPSSANLRGALTDENGTGAALFNAATTPDFTTGITIGGAAGSRKILVGDGTKFAPSTETYAVPGTSGNVMKSDGTNWTSGTVTAAPGGSTTQIQYNNASALGGISTFTTNGTDITLSSARVYIPAMTGGTSGPGLFMGSSGSQLGVLQQLDAGSSSYLFFANNKYYTGSAWSDLGKARLGCNIQLTDDLFQFYTFDTATTQTLKAVLGTNGQLAVAPGGMFAFGTVAGLPITPDTALARNAAGVVEVNNGTAGTYRDLKADELNAVTGFQVNGAAASGKLLQGNGTDYVASTPTWPTTAGSTGYNLKSDGTNFSAYPMQILNASVSSQSPSTSDVYLAGSSCVVAAGDFKAKGQYRCIFDVTKSAGTGGIVISVRTGTAGTTSDTANLTFTFPAGTSVADVGVFEVVVNWRTVGSGSSAVMSGFCRAVKNTITAAGLWNDTSAAKTIVATVSSGFNSTTFTNVGVSFNGGTAFAGTVTTVQAQLQQP